MVSRHEIFATRKKKTLYMILGDEQGTIFNRNGCPTMTIEFGVMHAISMLNTQTASVKENRIIVKIFVIN